MSIYRRHLPSLRWGGLWLVMTAVLSLAAAHYIPHADDLLFYDWVHHFEGAHGLEYFYPPWTAGILKQMNLSLLVGITLSSFGVSVIRQAHSPWSAAIAFINLPLFWVIFLGQLDGLVLLGLLGLPWLMPLVLLKPQVAGFALLADRRNLFFALVFLLISFAVWGFWPQGFLDLLHSLALRAEPKYPIVPLGWWGLPLFVLFAALIPRDQPACWMLAGAFISPYIHPHNLLPITPVIARFRAPWAALLAFSTWLPLAANWIGPAGWYLMWPSALMLLLSLIAVSRGRA